jgi:hypothetical protein
MKRFISEEKLASWSSIFETNEVQSHFNKRGLSKHPTADKPIQKLLQSRQMLQQFLTLQLSHPTVPLIQYNRNEQPQSSNKIYCFCYCNEKIKNTDLMVQG